MVMYLAFVISLIVAGYLGFALIELTNHDKLLHFLTFLVLTVEFYFIFDTNHKSLKTLRYITLLVCTFAGSILLEVIQSLVNTTRVFDSMDIVYNVVGSFLGVILSSSYDVWAVKRQKKNRFRQVREVVIEEDDDDDTGIELGGVSGGRDLENGFVSINREDLAESK